MKRICGVPQLRCGGDRLRGHWIVRSISWTAGPSLAVIVLLPLVLAAGEVPSGPKSTPEWPEVHRGVIGSKHDFNVPGLPVSSPCRTCHIPHIQAVRASTQPTTYPTTQPALELYRAPGQRRAFVPGEFTPGPASLMCLGCHDGTVATSTISGAHVLLAGVRAGFRAPGGYAWRDHPIGIPYPANHPDYRPEGFVTKEGKIKLPDGRVECISCHDPHNESGVDKMLVMSNRRSALCLACHIK